MGQHKAARPPLHFTAGDWVGTWGRRPPTRKLEKPSTLSHNSVHTPVDTATRTTKVAHTMTVVEAEACMLLALWSDDTESQNCMRGGIMRFKKGLE